MLENIKYRFKSLLPVEGVKPPCSNDNADIFVTLSLQRSGQHAVINWLCLQMRNIVHFNHCYFERINFTNRITPINNRITIYTEKCIRDSGIQDRDSADAFLSEIAGYSRLLYSFEDMDSDNELLKKYIHHIKPMVIIIIRDPYNWLASAIKHGQSSPEILATKKGVLIKYLEQALTIKDYIKHPVVIINFNKWASSTSYRKNILSGLSIPFCESADKALLEVPDFGGGSSFDEKKPTTGRPRMKVFDRWKDYLSDPVFIELLNDDYLNQLTTSFFQIKTPF